MVSCIVEYASYKKLVSSHQDMMGVPVFSAGLEL